jgi:hypothetical protein
MDRFIEESVFDLARNFRLSHEAEPEPFFAVAEPCQDCGRPTGGVDCPCHREEQPVEPRCPLEYQILMAAKTVGEMCDTVRAHRLSCPVCNPARKEAGRVEHQRWEKAA